MAWVAASLASRPCQPWQCAVAQRKYYGYIYIYMHYMMDNIIYYVSECLFDLIGQHVPWNMEFTYPQYIYIYILHRSAFQCMSIHINRSVYIDAKQDIGHHHNLLLYYVYIIRYWMPLWWICLIILTCRYQSIRRVTCEPIQLVYLQYPYSCI